MPGRPRFSLVIVSSLDGLIAREAGHAPDAWQSLEERAFFLDMVERTDWSILGRTTHQTAPRSDRRRIVFSRSAPEPVWRTPTQLWLDPDGLAPDDLADLVEPVWPMREALVLGGADVAAWFLRHGRLAEVKLSIEPVRFGAGLPIFPDGGPGDPVRLLKDRGFEIRSERSLNNRGTRLVTLAPARSIRRR